MAKQEVGIFLSGLKGTIVVKVELHKSAELPRLYEKREIIKMGLLASSGRTNQMMKILSPTDALVKVAPVIIFVHEITLIFVGEVILGNYHSARPPSGESHSSNQSEAEIVKHETSAAGIPCQLTTHHGTHAPQLAFTNDVLGIVATLGKVDDDNLSRLLSEYLGVETMLGIVCKTYEGVKALETYDKEGHINSDSGIRVFGTTIGRTLDGRFLVICLENLRPYCGEFVDDDPQRRLDLLQPKLPNGECSPGFIGFAVNMIHVDYMNLLYVSDVYSLKETLFYSLFSRLQVYKSREEMLLALPLISDGAISLDGGIIKPNGFFSLGNR
ncbi:protein DEFECTIVE IN MERISTEM SILENCING 3-like [Euphorbia lathyris]|uniref:protein DEFECTIVE IN MERISTEM SILENCING 3-like n=1 Tax=Euphorbia lathyris TaxID=212925 RepID=UPI0033138077